MSNITIPVYDLSGNKLTELSLSEYDGCEVIFLEPTEPGKKRRYFHYVGGHPLGYYESQRVRSFTLT